MWPIGHAAVGYLCWAALERSDIDDGSADLAAIAVVFGAWFPDLVDKPLAWQFAVLPTGRSLAHSLLVLIPLVILVAGLAIRFGYPAAGIAFGIGTISHPIVDAAPALWRDDTSVDFLFYPITAVEPYAEPGPPSISALLADSLTDPYFLLEFVLLGVAIVVWYRRGMPGVRMARSADAAPR